MNDIIKYKKILVTGGAGFIGSHLVDALVKSNRKVVIIDDLSTGSINNINKRALFYKVSTANSHKIKEIFQKEKPEVVYHLAANTNVPLSVKDPLYDFQQSLVGAMNIIDSCKNHKVKKIIYVSSGFIYGNTKNRPTKETEPFMMISPYGISKKTIEDYLVFYKKTYNLPFIIVRLATIYGPRQTKGAMSDYMDKLSSDQQAMIYGDGLKTRDYLFVADLIDALTKLLKLPVNFIDPIFNIGTARETSLKKLYFEIANILDKKADPIYMPDRPGELLFYSLDSAKLKKAISWEPQYDLAKGLYLTLKFRKLV